MDSGNTINIYLAGQSPRGSKRLTPQSYNKLVENSSQSTEVRKEMECVTDNMITDENSNSPADLRIITNVFKI
jgi:hypothetical protein